MFIREIMHKDIFSIDYESSIIDACKRFYRKQIGSLLVLEDGKLKGIITERDIISKVIILNKDPNETYVSDIMSTEVITVNQDSKIEEAVRIMNEKNIKKLPVVSDTGKIVGIITTSDITKIIK